SVAGVVWLIVFGAVVLTKLDEPGALRSSSMITAFGVAGALVAYLSKSAAKNGIKAVTKNPISATTDGQIREERWSPRGDSNHWPRECDSRALPTELRAHAKRNRQYGTRRGTAGHDRPVHILATMSFLFKNRKLPEGVDPARIPPGQTLTAPDRW